MNRSSVLDKLNSAVLSLTSSDGWQAWLRTRRAFHTYSFRNQILIACQTPSVTTESGVAHATAEQCTRVAGYRQWQKLGYQVVKGANAIGILAPCRPSKKQLREARENGEEVRVRFRGANVFDVSQTVPIDGEARPLEAPGRWGHVEGGCDPDLFADIALGAVTSLGVAAVEIEALTEEERRGYYAPADRSIHVSHWCAGAEAVAVLVHELAHHVDHTTPGRLSTKYAVGELVAESAAFLVCDALGIDAGDVASFYVAHWTKDLEDPAAALSEVAGRVLAVAQAIEDALANVRLDPDALAAAGDDGAPVAA